MKEEDFEWNTPELRDSVRREKRRSLIRQILITVITVVVAFYALTATGTYMIERKIRSEGWTYSAWSTIRGANITNAGSEFIHSFLGATEIQNRQKVIGGIPINWGEVQREYSPVSKTSQRLNFPVYGQETAEEEVIPLYYNGERLMSFYHPEKEYGQLPDDRSLMTSIRSDQVIEMAFSFDRAYTLAEIENIFPDNRSWIWVDSDQSDDQPVDAENAIGFKCYTDDLKQDADAFVGAADYLFKEDNGELAGIFKEVPKTGDIRAIGMVLTGTPDELSFVKDLPQIRAATLGATVDRY